MGAALDHLRHIESRHITSKTTAYDRPLRLLRARPSRRGVSSGFSYKTVPHVTLRSIVNNPDIKEGMTQAEIDAAIARHAPQETLYDQPLVDTGKKRVSGPFSVEAVPAPAVKPIDDVDAAEPLPADDTVARSGETLRQSDWRTSY